MSRPPRVVLDTNVVVSALLFAAGPTSRLRDAWRAGLFRPLASRATASELVRVLTYPKFALSVSEQQDLLADYLPWVSVVTVPSAPPKVPLCRDPCDVPFLTLSIVGKADALVSGDRDLLALTGSPHLCPVLSVEAFCKRYLE